MTIWFNKKNNGIKTYKSKSVSFNFYPQHFFKFQWKNNGAKKDNKKDTCFDLNIHFFGIFFFVTSYC